MDRLVVDCRGTQAAGRLDHACCTFPEAPHWLRVMSRSYRGVRLKRDRVYSVDQLMEKYGVCRNTLTNWIRSGLTTSDKGQPYVFRGAVVAQFHKDRAARSRTSLLPGEFRCLRCKTAVRPATESVSQKPSSRGGKFIAGACPQCGGAVLKFGSQSDLLALAGKPVPNTSVSCLHEETPLVPARTGKKPPKSTSKPYLRNDRLIFAWQLHAQRYSPKTQDRHLAAIREFETHVGGKRFSKLTREDVAGFREALRRSLSAEDGRSKPSIAHIASQVRAFLSWLVDQDDMDAIPRDLPGYLELARADYAKAIQPPSREYVAIDVAEKMLEAMPVGTLVERRARALFALAFLGALRADTLVSLQVRHILLESRQIVQDATVVRAKNGKSFTVNWFPIPLAFENEIKEWLDELLSFGAEPGDALFPDTSWLDTPCRILDRNREKIPVMATPHAATVAFRIASQGSVVRITPHTAKHTIAALRDELQLTREQRKAWSENMGHETEQITETYYGKLSDDRRLELFAEIGSARADEEKRITLSNQIDELKKARNSIDQLIEHLEHSC